MWHTKKPTSDEPLLFTENNFVKHKEGKAGAFTQPLSSAIARHRLLPPLKEHLQPGTLVKLVSRLRLAGHDVPALANIEKNDFQPVMTKLHSTTLNVAEEIVLDELFVQMEQCSLEANILYANDVEEAFIKDYLEISWDQSRTVERDTRFQSQTKSWHDQRLYRLTASMARTMLHVSDRSDPVKRFRALKKTFSSHSCRHGINNEAAAFSEFLNAFPRREKKPVQLSSAVGLLVHPKFPFLGASLDRLIKVDNELCAVEIKCPYNPFLRKQKLRLKMKDKAFYVNLSEQGKPYLKKDCDYYTQVQMQLMVSNLKNAFFVMFVPPNDVEYLQISRDEPFIDEMLQELSGLYEQWLLPAFAEEVYTK